MAQGGVTNQNQLASPQNRGLTASKCTARGAVAAAIDNSLRITTPENISFQYQLAGPFRRFFPYVLDLIIISAAYSAAVFLIVLLGSFVIVPLMSFLGLKALLDFFLAGSIALVVVGYFLVYWFYGAYCETYFNGRTIGKMATSMRVISTDGHAIDGVQATLRNFFRWIDLMPLLPVATLLESTELEGGWPIPTCMLGLVTMAVTPRYQRLGDLVAGTMVVNEEPQLSPDVRTFQDERVALLAEEIPESFYVSASLARAIADYVDHREQVGIARAQEIARKLAAQLRDVFHLPHDTDEDLLICSLYYKVFSGQKTAAELAASSSAAKSINDLSRIQVAEAAIADVAITQPPVTAEKSVTEDEPAASEESS
jgi:uncharacterized RDD family membrane protein YckC